MALTGQLSDMSLAELIEFFCNQRKTGRLKIDYPRGHSVFFIREGELVDARVGQLSGVEAVYFSLTLPNAAFDFSPDVQAQRRTINEPWTQVVLEGLRRLDEGLSPSESDAFGSGWSPTESELAQMLDQVEHLDAANAKKASEAKSEVKEAEEGRHAEVESAAPFSMMVESASGGGSKKKWMVAAGVGAVVLACAVVAVPLMSRSSKSEPAPAASTVSQPVTPAPATESASSESASESPEASPDASADASAADAAKRDALEREKRDRERKRKEEEAKRDEALTDPSAAKPAAPAPTAPSGPKTVRVTVTYDEAGRVTQASVAGASPGAEAYGSTAVRIARGKHFPTGKAGSTVITIPVN